MQTENKKLFQGQIITTEDLLEFKTALIEEIKVIAKDLQNNGNKKWLRSSDVKKMLNISHGKLQLMRNKGDLPFTRVGGVIFYDRDDINKMIDSRRVDFSL